MAWVTEEVALNFLKRYSGRFTYDANIGVFSIDGLDKLNEPNTVLGALLILGLQGGTIKDHRVLDGSASRSSSATIGVISKLEKADIFVNKLGTKKERPPAVKSALKGEQIVDDDTLDTAFTTLKKYEHRISYNTRKTLSIKTLDTPEDRDMVETALVILGVKHYIPMPKEFLVPHAKNIAFALKQNGFNCAGFANLPSRVHSK